MSKRKFIKDCPHCHKSLSKPKRQSMGDIVCRQLFWGPKKKPKK